MTGLMGGGAEGGCKDVREGSLGPHKPCTGCEPSPHCLAPPRGWEPQHSPLLSACGFMEAVGGSPRGRGDSSWHSTQTDLLAKLSFPEVRTSSLTLYLSIYHAVPRLPTLLQMATQTCSFPLTQTSGPGIPRIWGFPERSKEVVK